MRYFLGLLLLSSISSCFPTLSTARHLTSEQEGNGAQQQGVFLTREDNASALPRINPAFLGDEGSDGIHGWSTRDSLKYHDLQEKRIRTLLEEKIGRWPSRGQARLFGQARFQSMIREDFGPYGFERWVKYTDAMKTLLANDKCGPVWNQATNMYYVCCVFRVGLEDDTGYTSCLVPMSVGEIEPSSEDGIQAKFGVQYGLNDVMDSLPEEAKSELRKDFEHLGNVKDGLTFLSEEGDFQDEIMRLVESSSKKLESNRKSTGEGKHKSRWQNGKSKNSEPADDVEEKETDSLAANLLDMLISHEHKRSNPGGMTKRKDDKKYEHLQKALSDDIKSATSCAAEASEAYRQNMEDGNQVSGEEYRDESEAVSQGCQKTLFPILSKYRGDVYAMESNNSSGSADENGAVRVLGNEELLTLNSTVRQSTTGIWEYDFFAGVWIWVFDYSSGEQTAGSACHDSNTAIYSLCCDSVMALTQLCQELAEDAW